MKIEKKKHIARNISCLDWICLIIVVKKTQNRWVIFSSYKALNERGGRTVRSNCGRRPCPRTDPDQNRNEGRLVTVAMNFFCSFIRQNHKHDLPMCLCCFPAFSQNALQKALCTSWLNRIHCPVGRKRTALGTISHDMIIIHLWFALNSYIFNFLETLKGSNDGPLHFHFGCRPDLGRGFGPGRSSGPPVQVCRPPYGLAISSFIER